MLLLPLLMLECGNVEIALVFSFKEEDSRIGVSISIASNNLNLLHKLSILHSRVAVPACGASWQ